MFRQLRFLFQLTRAHTIARRYFVTNGFDGALTMLGLTMGFYSSDSVATPVIISACLGAATALSVSGLASAYVSERRRQVFGQQTCFCTRSFFIQVAEDLLDDHWIFASRALAFVPTRSPHVQQC